MEKQYPFGTIFYAESSKTYWGVVEIIVKPILHAGFGVVQKAREYHLVNDSGETILLAEEAMPFSLREIPDVGLEHQTLEASVKEHPKHPQRQKLNGLDRVTLALAKVVRKNAA